MGWGRRNTGTRLHISNDIKVVVVGKIGKRPVISNDLAAVIRLHLGIPLLLGSRQPLIEVLETLLEKWTLRWIHLRQFIRDAARDTPHVVGIEPVMRIAEWVHIALGARNRSLRYFQNLGELRSIEVAVGAHLNPGIPALCDQRRKPSDLKLQTNHHQQVRLLQFQQEAGLGFHKMRILISPGNGLDVHMVAAHFLRKRGHIRGGGHNIQLLGFSSRREQGRHNQGRKDHGCCLPREKICPTSKHPQNSCLHVTPRRDALHVRPAKTSFATAVHAYRYYLHSG